MTPETRDALSQADLHTANKKAAARGGSGAAADLDWQLEYSFKAQFGLDDMSVGSFEALAHRLASNNSASGIKQWVRSIQFGRLLYITNTVEASPQRMFCAPDVCPFIGSQNGCCIGALQRLRLRLALCGRVFDGNGALPAERPHRSLHGELQGELH